MMVAQGGFDKKEEVENPSEVLLNPSDPEATFRYKAGGRHLGYVGNVVEAVGEKSSLVIVYDYQQNTYADNQFMKDYLNEKKDFSDGSFIVADGAYSGEENSRLASEHNLKLVTTNLQDANQMKYMLILFLLMMENISSNVRIIVYLKTVSMIQAMSVPLRIFG